MNYEGMDPSEALAIACNSDITAMKDLNEQYLGPDATYLEANDLVQSLKDDKIGVSVSHPPSDAGYRVMEVSRWAWIPVRPEQRPNIMDTQAQYYQIHGNAKVKSKWGLDITPSEELPSTRIPAVRT